MTKAPEPDPTAKRSSPDAKRRAAIVLEYDLASGPERKELLLREGVTIRDISRWRAETGGGRTPKPRAATKPRTSAKTAAPRPKPVAPEPEEVAPEAEEVAPEAEEVAPEPDRVIEAPIAVEPEQVAAEPANLDAAGPRAASPSSPSVTSANVDHVQPRRGIFGRRARAVARQAAFLESQRAVLQASSEAEGVETYRIGRGTRSADSPPAVSRRKRREPHWPAHSIDQDDKQDRA